MGRMNFPEEKWKGSIGERTEKELQSKIKNRQYLKDICLEVTVTKELMRSDCE